MLINQEVEHVDDFAWKRQHVLRALGLATMSGHVCVALAAHHFVTVGACWHAFAPPTAGDAYTLTMPGP